MVIRAATKGPDEEPLILVDFRICDAGDPLLHETVVIKLPVLVAAGAEPLVVYGPPLADDANGEAVFVEAPKLFDMAIMELGFPFGGKETHNLGPTFNGLVPVMPQAIAGNVSDNNCRAA